MSKILLTLFFTFLLLAPAFSTRNPPSTSNSFWTSIFRPNRNRVPLSSNALTLSRQNAVRNYGRTLTQDLTSSLVPRFISFNNQLYSSAGSIPNYFPSNRQGLARAIQLPIRLGAIVGNLFAPAIVRRVVSRPINAITNQAVDMIGLWGSGTQFVENTIGRFPRSTRTVPTFIPLPLIYDSMANITDPNWKLTQAINASNSTLNTPVFSL